jgi:hypothetical protein
MTYNIHDGQLTFETTAAIVTVGAPAQEPVSLITMVNLLVLLLGLGSLF